MGLRRTAVWNETRELKHSAIDGSPVWRVLPKGRAEIPFQVAADLQTRQAKAVLILLAAAGTTRFSTSRIPDRAASESDCVARTTAQLALRRTFSHSRIFAQQNRDQIQLAHGHQVLEFEDEEPWVGDAVFLRIEQPASRAF